MPPGDRPRPASTPVRSSGETAIDSTDGARHGTRLPRAGVDATPNAPRPGTSPITGAAGVPTPTQPGSFAVPADEPGWWTRWRQRRAARRAAPYPGPLRRIGSAIGLVVVVTIAGLAVALTTGLLVVALLVLVDRALAT